MIAPSLVAGSGRSRKKTSLAVHPDAVRVTARTPTPMAAARTRRRSLPCWTRGAPAVITWLECRTDRLPRSVDVGRLAHPAARMWAAPRGRTGLLRRDDYRAFRDGPAPGDGASRPGPPTPVGVPRRGRRAAPAAGRAAGLAGRCRAGLERPGPPAPPRPPGRDAARRRPREHRGQPRRAPGRGLPDVLGPDGRGCRRPGPDGPRRAPVGRSSAPSRAWPCTSPAERWATAVEAVPVDRTGRVDVAALGLALATPADLLCVQAANGEVGTRQPLAEVAAAARAAGVPLLVHAVQVIGRGPVPADWDVLVASARDWGGPAGVGVLVVRSSVRWTPDENPDRGWVNGFPDIPGAAAAATALEYLSPHVAAEADRQFALTELIRSRAAPARGGHRGRRRPVDRLPHIVTFTCAGVTGETVVRRARPARRQRGQRLGLHLRHAHAQPGPRGDGPGRRRLRAGVAAVRVHGGDRRGLPPRAARRAGRGSVRSLGRAAGPGPRPAAAGTPCRGISTAPSDARWSVLHCTSSRRLPPHPRSVSTSDTSATFDASRSRWNIDSPANRPPISTP